MDRPKGRASTLESTVIIFRLCRGLGDTAVFLFRTVLGVFVLVIRLRPFRSLYEQVTVVCAKRLLKPYLQDGYLDFNGIHLACGDGFNFWRACIEVAQDTFYGYLSNNDRYDRAFLDKSEKYTFEGLYCLEDEQADIMIHAGDTVLDLGAWAGDFAAYAAYRGARVFAFEPDMSNLKLLERTAALNDCLPGRIEIVPLGVGAQRRELEFYSDGMVGSGSGFIQRPPGAAASAAHVTSVAVTTLDEWTAANGIKVDFIKADIEGFERHMLEGAQRLLKTQAPILSLCTYHLPDDPEVIADLILKANPAYRIIMRRAKLLAYVPA
jgi:FkbM family methyltransferase